MKKRHIFERVSLIGAFDSGREVAAVCGKVKTLTSKRQNKMVDHPELFETCTKCESIQQVFVRFGQADPVGPPQRAEELNKQPPARVTYYYFGRADDWTTNKAASPFPPAA